MGKKLFDSTRNGFYRENIQDFDIVFKDSTESMGLSHYHPYFELCYVQKGQCRIFVEHKLFWVNAGQLVILPPSTLHRSQYEYKEPAQRINVSFTKDFAQNALGQDADFLQKTLTLGKMSFNEEQRILFEDVLKRLLEENDKNDAFSSIYKHGLLLTLFALIGRNGTNLKKEELIDPTTASVQNAAKYIFENYDRAVTLQKASEVAGMCDTYFSKKFLEITGYGFKEYLTNVRIKKSQEMLLNGQLTITQIALSCGFSDANYFGDAFKKYAGCSPREFRKQIQKRQTRKQTATGK